MSTPRPVVRQGTHLGGDRPDQPVQPSVQPEPDPAAHEIPTGIMSVWYHLRRRFSSELQTLHVNRLRYDAWQSEVAAAERAWVAENERLRAEHDAEQNRLSEERESHRAIMREQVANRKKLAERAFKENRVCVMMGKGVQPVFAVLNIKSGGKTTLALLVGSIMAQLGRQNSVLFPYTLSPESGASGEISGLIHERNNPLSVMDFDRNLDQYTTVRELNNDLGRTKHGLNVFIEDNDGSIEEYEFGINRLREMRNKLYLLEDGCIILDTANEKMTESQPSLDAVRAADVIVFVASRTQPVSLPKMRYTIRMVAKDMHRGASEDANVVMPGELRSTQDKYDNSLIVINGVKETDTPYPFDEHVEEGWNGQGFNVPYDEYIFTDSDGINPIDLDALNEDTYMALLDVTLAILEEGARVRGIALDSLPEFEPEVFDDPGEYVAEPYVETDRPEIPEPDYESVRSS